MLKSEDKGLFFKDHNNLLEEDKSIKLLKKERAQSFMCAACSIYAVFLALCAMWTLMNLWERWNQLISPVSSNGFDIENFHQLIYPAITICNLTPNVKISHKKCMSYQDEINCENKEETFDISDKSLLKTSKDIKDINCLSYNSNLDNNAFISTNIAMQDLIIISVSININDYPVNSFLSGVSISLHSQGKRPSTFYNGILANPGEVFLIRLKKVVNEYLNNTSIESFDAKISTIGNQNFEQQWGSKNDTVVVAFTYQDLNVMIIRQLPPYTILSFLAETGGVFGFFVGTSIVNFFIFTLQWVWGLRFNEANWFNVQNLQEEANKQKDNPPPPLHQRTFLDTSTSYLNSDDNDIIGDDKKGKNKFEEKFAIL